MLWGMFICWDSGWILGCDGTGLLPNCILWLTWFPYLSWGGRFFSWPPSVICWIAQQFELWMSSLNGLWAVVSSLSCWGMCGEMSKIRNLYCLCFVLECLWIELSRNSVELRKFNSGCVWYLISLFFHERWSVVESLYRFFLSLLLDFHYAQPIWMHYSILKLCLMLLLMSASPLLMTSVIAFFSFDETWSFESKHVTPSDWQMLDLHTAALESRSVDWYTSAVEQLHKGVKITWRKFHMTPIAFHSQSSPSHGSRMSMYRAKLFHQVFIAIVFFYGIPNGVLCADVIWKSMA